MKALITILCLTMLSATAWAQDEFGEESVKARQILDKVKAKVESFSTIYIEYEATMINTQADMEEKSKGKLFIKGNMFKLYFLDMVIYNNGTTQWNHDVDMEEVTISEPDPDEVQVGNLKDLLSSFKEKYKMRLISDIWENERPIYVIELYPRDRDVAYSAITIKIDKDKNMPVAIRYQGKDGNIYIIDLKLTDTKKTMDDSTFVFSKSAYPGVEVIDMR